MLTSFQYSEQSFQTEIFVMKEIFYISIVWNGSY